MRHWVACGARCDVLAVLPGFQSGDTFTGATGRPDRTTPPLTVHANAGGGLLRYCEDVSFCGCLEAVTDEGGEKP